MTFEDLAENYPEKWTGRIRKIAEQDADEKGESVQTTLIQKK